MTRQEAIITIYTVIKAGIIDIELANELKEIADCIENDSFESKKSKRQSPR